MTGNLYQDWPVYFLLGAVVIFFIYAIIKGNKKNPDNAGDKKNN